MINKIIIRYICSIIHLLSFFIIISKNQKKFGSSQKNAIYKRKKYNLHQMQNRSHSMQDFACSVIFLFVWGRSVSASLSPLVRMVFRSSTPRAHI